MSGETLGQERVVPAWVVAVDNIPTIAMFLLGSALIWKAGPLYSLLYLIYCLLAIFMFWYLICPWCRHFGTSGCPCGYGSISSRLFKRKSGREFKKVFRKNIGMLLPCWILPLGTGIYLLWTSFGRAVLFLFLSFCIVGFILIPAISKYVGCKSCTIKDECPWMSHT
jgi:hypothetical protein